DQLGISLGRILRVQAADTRLKRQAAAEEKAMKASIKMLFPLVLFIFPSMFLVILGSALLNLKHLFISDSDASSPPAEGRSRPALGAPVAPAPPGVLARRPAAL